jgi:hypothetical protein
LVLFILLSLNVIIVIEFWVTVKLHVHIHLSLDIEQIVFGLAVEHAICHGVDLCSSFFGSIKLAHEICVNISLF